MDILNLALEIVVGIKAATAQIAAAAPGDEVEIDISDIKGVATVKGHKVDLDKIVVVKR